MLWKQVLTYLDDLNVISNNFQDHLDNLAMSFERLKEYNLKIKSHKFFFFQKEVPFVGKLATNEGIAVDPNKVEAVTSWPVPTCQRDVESFLGFANSHQTHIKEHVHIAGPLYGLTGLKATFHLEDKHWHTHL